MPRPVILLTRPLADARRFAGQLTEVLGPQEVLLSPLIVISPLGMPPAPEPDEVVLLTSAHGLPSGRGRAYCVGPRTARVAREAGFEAIEAGATASEACARIVKDGVRRVFYPHGRHVAFDVAAALAGGPALREAVTYDQVAKPLNPVARDALSSRKVLAPVFSRRTAGLLAAEVAELALHDLSVIGLRPEVLDPFPDLPAATRHNANSADADGMIRALGDLL